MMKNKSKNTWAQLLKEEKNPARRKSIMMFKEISDHYEKYGIQSKLTSVQLLRKYSR